jgi:hypothetical protein
MAIDYDKYIVKYPDGIPFDIAMPQIRKLPSLIDFLVMPLGKSILHL